MFPFWEMVVAPLVKHSDAKRVLEIGALRGETTAKMFDQLGPESELHVIDPLPQFDPAEHEREFPGRYVFHRDLSLNVLGDLPPFDVALVDGDHNWYTVYHELHHLERTARGADQHLPVLVLHDVAWPYGHRDLYYEPSQIPEEFRQPWARKGMAPGFYKVLDEGGMNAELANAIHAGGPRNGVKRALDDFLEDYDQPHRLVLLPFYFGLAIVVDQKRLDSNPRLSRFLDRLESPEGQERLLRLSERIRLDEQVHVHNWNRRLERRAVAHRDRYMALLKAALLDEHYIDNEVRISYLTSLPPGSAPDGNAMRDPARTMEVRFKRIAQARRAGRSADELKGMNHYPYTDMGRAAIDHLDGIVASIADRDVPGDFVDCGVGRGGAAVLMRAGFEAYGIREAGLWLIDPFLASTAPDPDIDSTTRAAQVRADLNQVRDAFDRFDLFDERTRFVTGPFNESLPGVDVESIALLRIGPGGDIEAALRHLLPRVSAGGTVVVEGIGAPKSEKALAKAREALGVTDPITRVGWNMMTWEVSAPSSRTAEMQVEDGPAHRIPLVPPVEEQCDLSVVVVFYNMRREAARTLHSLSRSYQRDIEDLDYEVLVIDNGSDPDQALSPEEIASYGPEFRAISLDRTPPSPTHALNAGIAASHGRAVAVMIDGAHVLTPGVFAQALTAMRAYEPAVVAIQQWYLGPGQQGDAQQAGYDQKAEDRLLDRIKWPSDGYRLFDIGHFIGDRDWFDGIIESNCLFVPRSVLEQVGGFDDSFDMAGGGYANLELFERVHSHPGVNPASVLGEGTFHQFHGGTTTNVADEAVRRERIFSYGQHFRELRGRGLLGLNKPVRYVGSMDTKAARRTRSRREFLLGFDPARDAVSTTTTEPQPVPEELKLAAIEAAWYHQSWRDATWMGHPVCRYPTDLHSYQELLVQVVPEVVILLGEDHGLAGRALHAASVLDQVGSGRVIAVTSNPGADAPAHQLLTYVTGAPDASETVAKVLDLAGPDRALVFIGLGSDQRVRAAFDAYSPLVPDGSYVVIENTVVNGRPVESGFGPGAHEAVAQILASHSDFVPDVAFERYTLTFNKNGYLRRYRTT